MGSMGSTDNMSNKDNTHNNKDETFYNKNSDHNMVSYNNGSNKVLDSTFESPF